MSIVIGVVRSWVFRDFMYWEITISLFGYLLPKAQIRIVESNNGSDTSKSFVTAGLVNCLLVGRFTICQTASVIEQADLVSDCDGELWQMGRLIQSSSICLFANRDLLEKKLRLVIREVREICCTPLYGLKDQNETPPEVLVEALLGHISPGASSNAGNN